eukprot:GHVU01208359.1.p1 GENE.GHVU01208359.1~~GHVU01208359.1.p1  ORF type:complete len:225 (-),score=13.83 GHVU01208359.1:324-998(-)
MSVHLAFIACNTCLRYLMTGLMRWCPALAGPTVTTPATRLTAPWPPSPPPPKRFITHGVACPRSDCTLWRGYVWMCAAGAPAPSWCVHPGGRVLRVSSSVGRVDRAVARFRGCVRIRAAAAAVAVAWGGTAVGGASTGGAAARWAAAASASDAARGAGGAAGAPTAPAVAAAIGAPSRGARAWGRLNSNENGAEEHNQTVDAAAPTAVGDGVEADSPPQQTEEG